MKIGKEDIGNLRSIFYILDNLKDKLPVYSDIRRTIDESCENLENILLRDKKDSWDKKSKPSIGKIESKKIYDKGYKEGHDDGYDKALQESGKHFDSGYDAAMEEIEDKYTLMPKEKKKTIGTNRFSELEIE